MNRFIRLLFPHCFPVGVFAMSAASAAAGGQNKAAELDNQQKSDNIAALSPYTNAGKTSLNSIMGGLGLGKASGGVSSGQFSHQFDNADLNSNLAPNYEFQLGQGLGAVNNQNSVTGGLVGGNSLKAINDYAQNFAGNAYQQAFDNYNTNQSNIYNRLANIAGLGQTSATNLASINSGLTTDQGNRYVGAGNAQAAGLMGLGRGVQSLGTSIASMFGG